MSRNVVFVMLAVLMLAISVYATVPSVPTAVNLPDLSPSVPEVNRDLADVVVSDSGSDDSSSDSGVSGPKLDPDDIQDLLDSNDKPNIDFPGQKIDIPDNSVGVDIDPDTPKCILSIDPDDVYVRPGGTVIFYSNLAGVSWSVKYSDNYYYEEDGTYLVYHAPKYLRGSELVDYVTVSKGDCSDTAVVHVRPYEVKRIVIKGPEEVEVTPFYYKVNLHEEYYVRAVDKYGNPVEGMGIYVDLVPLDVDGSPDSELNYGTDDGWHLHLVSDSKGIARFDLVVGYHTGTYRLEVEDADGNVEVSKVITLVEKLPDNNNNDNGGDDNNSTNDDDNGNDNGSGDDNGNDDNGNDDNGGTVTDNGGSHSSGGHSGGHSGITGRGVYFVNVTRTNNVDEEPEVVEEEEEEEEPVVDNVNPINVVVKYPSSVYVGDDIKVTVKDTSGNPVMGRMVTFIDPMGNEIQKYTDMKGSVSTVALREGVYSVKVDGAQGTLRIRAVEKPKEEPKKEDNKGIFGLVGAVVGEDNVVPALAFMGLVLLAMVGAGIYYLSQGDAISEEDDFTDEFGDQGVAEENVESQEDQTMMEGPEDEDVIDLTEEVDDDEKL